MENQKNLEKYIGDGRLPGNAECLLAKKSKDCKSCNENRIKSKMMKSSLGERNLTYIGQSKRACGKNGEGWGEFCY